MNLIRKAAWLDVCVCGDHARFVLGDDTNSREFCSKDAGRKELRQLRTEKLIDDAELRFLSDQVNSCRLPISDVSADLATVLTSDFLNKHRSQKMQEHQKGYIM